MWVIMLWLCRECLCFNCREHTLKNLVGKECIGWNLLSLGSEKKLYRENAKTSNKVLTFGKLGEGYVGIFYIILATFLQIYMISK